MEKFEIVERNLASRWQRFANYLIDLVVFYLGMFSLGLFIGLIGQESILYVLDDRFLDKLISMIFYVLFMFGIEAVLEGKSIGKMITGTKVVTDYGEKPSTKDFLIRSFSRIVPFEAFSFLVGYLPIGWHDKWSNTRVVKVKTFDLDMQNMTSVEEIGND